MAPTDYQLVGEDGAVAEAFGGWASAAGIFVGSLWGQMRWLVVERRAPRLSDHGELQPIHRGPPLAGASAER